MTGPDLADYRHHPREQARIQDLFGLMPARGASALDIGARDGYLSTRLADRFDRVVALDLVQPQIDDPRVECAQGDASRLQFPDDSFDLVLCAEVLEHIPSARLPRVCAEIARVTAVTAIIGVPYRQDLRVGRSTCLSCGLPNPPWGHVNSFDESRIAQLFSGMTLAKMTYVGSTRDITNAIAAKLMDFAGNPYGTYEQDEGCVHCGALLVRPARRTAAQRVATRLAHHLNNIQRAAAGARASWMHVRFDKPARTRPPVTRER
jgi:hypothetical protein